METSSQEYKGIHIIVDGHVQGVGYRYFVYDFAAQKGLTGWVRNRYTGEVEILAEGLQSDLDGLVEHARRGPSRSMVTDLKYEWRTASRLYDKFAVLPTE